MTDHEFMNLAIIEAAKCEPSDPRIEPRVGAVIAVDGQVISIAHRGQHDHAEKIALTQAGQDVDLSKATVYTTLEPCTREVRRGTLESCSERLIAAHVKKVVIGILDPNQGVTGKGVLRLQEHQIEVQLFPEELAQRIRRMNDEFIRAQQSLGVRITAPLPTEVVRVRGSYRQAALAGTLTNLPIPGEEVYAVVQQLQHWWPQGQIVIDPQEMTWRTSVTLGREGEFTVHLIKVSPLGRSLIRYYYKIGEMHKRARGIAMTRHKIELSHDDLPEYPSIEQLVIPKGWDVEDRCAFVVTNE